MAEQKDYFTFGLRKKPIVSSYNGVTGTKNYINGWKSYSAGETTNLVTFVNGSYLDPYFKQPGTHLPECIQISNTLYATNRIYQNILNYFSNMFYWRSVTIPRKIRNLKSTTSKEEYNTVYNKMLEVVDGFNVEVAFPNILSQLFREGSVNLYAYGDKTSKTLAIILLPNKYCVNTVKTQYGTTQINFDFTFFDTVAFNEESREKLFEIFPPEFKELYELSKGITSRILPLNPKLSTCIALNDKRFPTFLSVFYDLIDYKTYKLNELDKSTNGLEKLVTQQIDLEKTGLELPEIKDLHESMANEINGNGVTLVTSVGSIDVKQLQESNAVENKTLANSYDSIFDNAGLNNSLFTCNNDIGIEASLKRDASYVWKYVEELVNFYNLAANNSFNFGAYQLSFKILPLSSYNESEKLTMYRQNATLGVNIIDLFVASGVKQIDIESTLELEENLDLINRLRPLQSSHTQSSSTTENANNVKDKEESVPQNDDNNNNNNNKTSDESKEDESNKE